ncbi:hypothetical protein SNEBB_009016 [Seison nebaliae]|nr:hypothetical protein SNEBB_009016 [Seison nebaliae]
MMSCFNQINRFYINTISYCLRPTCLSSIIHLNASVNDQLNYSTNSSTSNVSSTDVTSKDTGQNLISLLELKKREEETLQKRMNGILSRSSKKNDEIVSPTTSPTMESLRNDIQSRKIRFHHEPPEYYPDKKSVNDNCSKVQTEKKTFSLHRLSGNTRSLVLIKGDEAATFLQGILTNDILHLKKRDCCYSFLLNARGRILYDAIVYRCGEYDHLFPSYKGNQSFLLEVDRKAVNDVMKLLQLYRLRRQISIDVISRDIISIWTAVPIINSMEDHSLELYGDSAEEIVISMNQDPRHSSMGYRLLIDEQSMIVNLRQPSPINLNNHLTDCRSQELDALHYRRWLYSIGVCEGYEDIPLNKAIPFEYNGDLLKAISFDKGCYIGQELVSKTYHTGVIRKRIVPIKLINVPLCESQRDSMIYIGDNNKPIGRIRGNVGEYGVALLKMEDVKTIIQKQNDSSPNSSFLTCRGEPDGHEIKIRISIPQWWPKDSNHLSKKLFS